MPTLELLHILLPVGCLQKPSFATQQFDHDEKETTKEKIRSSIHGRHCKDSAIVIHYRPVLSSTLLGKFILNTAFSVAILYSS